MRADIVEAAPVLDSPLDRLDARLKVVLTLVFVIAVVVTPIRLWGVYVLEATLVLFAYGLGRRPWRTLLARLGVVLPFLILIAGSVVLARALQGGWALGGQVLIRALLALTATITLVVTTPFPRILAALDRLHAPTMLLSILAFMYRYLFVLVEELSKMRRAKLARTFRRDLSTEVRLLANFVGILFVRAFERAERVHAAMQARGWTGSLHHLDEDG